MLSRMLPWSLRRHFMVMSVQTYNVIQLGVAFFLVFFAFNSASFIEEVVIHAFAQKGRIYSHAGYNSLAIIYGMFTVCNLFAASAVHQLGVKWAMVVGALAYTLFQAGFLVLHEALLYVLSALLGLGAALIWTGQGKYLAMNSTDETAEKHSGIFWATSQACLACGGVFMYFVFHSDEDTISDQTILILYGVFTAVTFLGMLLLCLLRLPSNDIDSDISPALSQPREDEVELNSIIHMLRQRRVLYMIVVFLFTGVSLSFWSSIYPTCVGFSSQLGPNRKRLVAYNAITEGLGQAAGGFFFGILGSRFRRLGRRGIVAVAALVNLLAYAGVFINIPNDAPIKQTDAVAVIQPNLPLALTVGFALGFGDAIWNTQVFAFLISKFAHRSAQAFALFKFFQSLAACVILFGGASMTLIFHISILIVGTLVAALCFFLAEGTSDAEEGVDNPVAPHID